MSAIATAVAVRYIPPQLDGEEREFLATCSPATCTLQPSPSPLFTTLRHISIRGRRYEDKVAFCACADLQLYENCGYGYTTCNEHGLTLINSLKRDLGNGSGRAVSAKAVRHG